MVSLTFTPECRPCIVYRYPEPRKALCHLFTTRAGEGKSFPVAVVEYEDGEVVCVTPECVRFLDTRAQMEQYAWERKPNTEGSQ